MQFIFGDHTLDTERHELFRRGAAIAVKPQVFDLLVYLLQNRDRVVSKDDLIGISEDIIIALSKLRWFFVIARNSSFIYKDKAVHLKQIAEELGVRYVVEGSVRKDGDLVRITAQLNDATTGSHIWADHYDRDITDVFAVQDEITDAIVATIEPKIYVAENFHARRKPPNSLDAWDLVMRAMSHFWRVTRQDNMVAQAPLEKAIAIGGCTERTSPHATEYLARLDRQPVAMEAGLRPRALSGGLPPGGLELISGQRGHRPSGCSRARVFAASSRA